jgi:hypothetical protein
MIIYTLLSATKSALALSSTELWVFNYDHGCDCQFLITGFILTDLGTRCVYGRNMRVAEPSFLVLYCCSPLLFILQVINAHLPMLRVEDMGEVPTLVYLFQVINNVT